LASLVSGITGIKDEGVNMHGIGHGTEFPFLMFSGRNNPLNIVRQCIHLSCGETENHKTLGNWHATLLNEHEENAVKHHAALDLALEGAQTGPIKDFYM